MQCLKTQFATVVLVVLEEDVLMMLSEALSVPGCPPESNYTACRTALPYRWREDE